MHRAITFLLTLIFSLGPLATALPGNDEARLPACCRRLGAHHCAMMMANGSATPSFSAPMQCPDYPGTAPALIGSSHALIVIPVAVPELKWVNEPTLSVQIMFVSRAGKAHSGRGPPALQLI